MTTAVPAIQFTTTGPVAPTEADILAGIQTDIDAAFGGGVNPALNTPQGQIASSTAAIIGDKNAEILALANNFNPDYADGRWQDGLARIYFLDRKPALPTILPVTCIGAVGTVIPVGALVADGNGNTYACTGAGTIPMGGSITLDFACSVAGPTPIPASVAIYRAIPGWDTVSLAAGGTVGQDVESRADFEFRRRQSVALNAHGSLPSIYAAVFAAPGVLDVHVRENCTDAPVAVGATSYYLAPHSIYVAAVGGLDADVAQAIWTKKNVGADCNGNTVITVTDTSGYQPPYPTYLVQFERPAALPIKVAVQIANNPRLPADIVAQVKTAIVSAFSGGDGGPRARIGSRIFASRFYGPVAAIGANVSILSILVGVSSTTLPSVEAGIDQIPTITAADISVSLI